MAHPTRPRPDRVPTEIPPSESNSDCLLVGISKTLEIPQSDILLCDSFADLGGNKELATKLEQRMLRYGVRISCEDILRCKTLAELQAHTTSIHDSASSSSQDTSERTSADTAASLNEPERVFTPTKGRETQESIYGPPPDIDVWKDATLREGQGAHQQVEEPKSEKALGKEPSNNVQIDLDDATELVQFLCSVARGEYFCLVRASAGPFEHQLVAFVSTRNQSVSEAEGISLPPERDYEAVEGRIKRFYTALREWGGSVPWPDVWVPLHSMITKSNGKPATRALQWWLRNLTEDVEQRVLSLQRLLSLQLLDRQPKGESQIEEQTQQEAPVTLPPLAQEQLAAPSSEQPAISEMPQLEQAHQPEPQALLTDKLMRQASRGQPDIIVFKPEPIPEEDEPEEEIEIALQQAKAVPAAAKIARPGVRDSMGLKIHPPSYSQQDSLIIQNRLSTTRPEKTFSMWVEDESGRLEVHEQMADTPDDVEFFPLSAMQQLFFRTSMNLNPKPESITEPGYRFSQSVLLRVKADSESPDIEAAVEALVNRHSMLRSRFRLTREGWAQVILPESRNTYRYGHHQVTDEKEITGVVERAHAAINPINGPIFSAEHIRAGDNQQFIFLVAHHLAIDLVSWRIVIHDMDELLREGTLLSNPSIPFSNWIEYQGYEMSHRLVQPKLPFEISPPSLGYWDLDLDGNVYGNTQQFSFALNSELTHSLRTACRQVFRTEPADLLLTALLLSFCQTFLDREAPTLWTQEHGRQTKNEDFNIDETVGWFTSLCPISLMASSDSDFMELLKLMKDTRKAIPNSGIPFFNTEFLTPSAPFTTIPVEILFSCVDKMHKLHRKNGALEPVARPDRVADTVTSDIGPNVGRVALFEISVAIEDAEARIEAVYIKPQRQNRIEQWLKHFEALAVGAIGKLKMMGPELTLADAPLLKTTYRGLSQIAEDRLEQLGLDNVGEIETVYPINPSQQEILIAQSLNPEHFWNHAIYEFSTSERRPVSQGKLCAAWTSIVQSHSALRSVFIDSVTEDGLFDQVVLKKISPEMLFLDSESPVETLESLPKLKTSSTRPRHRFCVCKTSTKTFVRIDASQAICDSIAIDNLITRLRMAYAEETDEAGDNTLLLQTWLYQASTSDTSQILESWQGLLADAKPCNFPTLTSKPNDHMSPCSRPFGLEVNCAKLQEFSRQREVEVIYVLQLAWAIVLRVYVGMDHVTFGYEAAGRDENQMPGIKHEIGSFAAQTPCTVDLSPGRTIIECLHSLGEVAAIAKQGRNPTMAEIQHTLKLNTDDLFNTCLSMRDFDNARHKYPELDAASFRANLVTSSRISDTDLSMSTMFIDDHLHANLAFRRMTPVQAQNIVHTFERAIRIILDTPTQNIGTIDLFTDRDHAQLVVQDFDSKPVGDKVNTTLPQLILPHAQSRPEAPAICAWDGNMTYHQMVYCVSTLSTYLRNIGITPGMPVPVVLEKSKWAPVIMLAVLKAGGTVVSLDAHECSAVEASVKQLDSRIVVATDSAWNDIVCIVPNLVIVNERFFSILPPQVTIPARDPTPDHGACMIYSPGKSRSGALRSLFFTHGSLCAAFKAQGPALKLNRDSRVLQLAAFNVDVALVEILGTMVHGGCICIPSAKDRQDNLAGVLASMNVTWSYMTSTLARRIDPAKVPNLKTLCFRTRRLDEYTRQSWMPNRHVLLAYGAPDICPLGISVAEVEASNNTTMVPQPLAGRFWILNPEDPKKLTPLGAVGELAIDCPLLTPHKFVPGQIAEAPSRTGTADSPGRLRYLKTGHRVRYLDDKSIQFLSSMRDDVYIDGTRVSVSDIEHQLRRCLGSKYDVVVESVTTHDSIQLLAAFLELGDDLEEGSEDLYQLRARTKERTQLAKALRRASSPTGGAKGLAMEHIPSVFIPLKQLPISSSLKVNRRKLQKMVSAMNYSQLMGVATTANAEEAEAAEKPLPLTHVEERMRHVWAGTLDIPPSNIKSNDSFLWLGGDKYLAKKLVVAARRSSLTVTLNDILGGASLTEVCQAMAAADIKPVLEVRRSLQRTESRIDSFKIPNIEENFVKDYVAPQMKVHYREVLDVVEASAFQIHGLETRMYGKKGGIKCLVFNFNGPIRAQKLQTACETLSRLHPIFRTAFAVHDRHVYQVLLDGFRPEFQRYPCPAWCLGSVADNVIAEDQGVDFKPEEPATKFTFLDAGQQSTLIVRLSSAQIDEASVTLLVQELAALYEGHGNVSSRPNFFDYTRAAQAANNQGTIDFWREKLDGAKMTQFAAHVKPCSPASDIQTLRQSIQIDPVSEYGLNFGTVLKAAWAIVLAQYAASSDVVFGVVTQAQNIPLPDRFDASAMIAPTANIVPMRVRFPDTQETPLDFMRVVQASRTEVRAHEGMGILELVQNCTDWPYWTRFSTVVHHRPQPPPDGATTLNMGDTTFTHTVIEPGMQDLPDILIQTTTDGPHTVNFELKYSEGRVPSSFAEDALRVLTIAVDMITSYDTIEKPMVQSATEITRSAPKIPIAFGSPVVGDDTSKRHQSLPHDERQALQSLISAVWSGVVDPKALGVPDDQVHKAKFFDLWGSVLPAQTFADRINAEFAKQPIKGLNKLRVTPAEIIEHPTMAAQYELIVKKMSEAGIVSSITRRKQVMSWANGSNGGVNVASANNHAPPGGRSTPTENKWPSNNQGIARKSTFGRFRGLQHSGSVRDLGSKAGDWVRRHRSSHKSHDSVGSGPKGVMISEPVPTELPPRALELQHEYNEQNGGRWTPIQNEGRSTTPTTLRSNTPRPLNPQSGTAQQPTELAFSPMSPSARRASGDSSSTNEESPVSPLGPAWLAT
ncbi:uncharacterized protein J7T54_000774 [Emericellopsis cladophorae]|uniref:Uncharacterized protein n=1 Tax=Emericellopsis cladophorae TaxID=2686198 RepID=A0A9P9XWI6_9HYPO|nr:uncharacterized protein J7T54_000774 [Emericellopsis cladophorae]KAI6778740.1 hypothetical protein J7T54_000774 [Emericellopsis cladophorae]